MLTRGMGGTTNTPLLNSDQADTARGDITICVTISMYRLLYYFSRLINEESCVLGKTHLFQIWRVGILIRIVVLDLCKLASFMCFL